MEDEERNSVAGHTLFPRFPVLQTHTPECVLTRRGGSSLGARVRWVSRCRHRVPRTTDTCDQEEILHPRRFALLRESLALLRSDRDHRCTASRYQRIQKFASSEWLRTPSRC